MSYNIEKGRFESDVFDGVEVPVEEPEDEDWFKVEWRCSQEKCEDSGVPEGKVTPCTIKFKMKDGEEMPIPQPECPYGGEFTIMP